MTLKHAYWCFVNPCECGAGEFLSNDYRITLESTKIMEVSMIKSLTQLRIEAHATAVEHGFTDATPLEELCLIHTEISEAVEDIREGKELNAFLYKISNLATTDKYSPHLKPIGIPSEMADIIIRVLDFCGKHRIDIERAVLEKMEYNKTRPFKHGGKKL
jgi:NTP pyrophosphatase (non-canonical NTP hydrolase)